MIALLRVFLTTIVFAALISIIWGLACVLVQAFGIANGETGIVIVTATMMAVVVALVGWTFSLPDAPKLEEDDQ